VVRPGAVAFGLLLWAWHSTLLQLLLPFRFLAAECALTGGAISFIAWFLLRAASASPVKQAALLLFAVSGLVLGAWQYRAQSLAYTQSIVSFQDRGVTLVGTL
jgi:hypothetical protein